MYPSPTKCVSVSAAPNRTPAVAKFAPPHSGRRRRRDQPPRPSPKANGPQTMPANGIKPISDVEYERMANGLSTGFRHPKRSLLAAALRDCSRFGRREEVVCGLAVAVALIEYGFPRRR